ncbi:MAG: hypothetical protein R2736_00310 [Solirubrobacterales bacterium]
MRPRGSSPSNESARSGDASGGPDQRTFRGRSLSEVLPQIKQELGEDAVAVEVRHGRTGGVGGFFAQRCVEVDAIPGGPADGVDFDALLAAASAPAEGPVVAADVPGSWEQLLEDARTAAGEPPRPDAPPAAPPRSGPTSAAPPSPGPMSAAPPAAAAAALAALFVPDAAVAEPPPVAAAPPAPSHVRARVRRGASPSRVRVRVRRGGGPTRGARAGRARLARHRPRHPPRSPRRAWTPASWRRSSARRSTTCCRSRRRARCARSSPASSPAACPRCRAGAAAGS